MSGSGEIVHMVLLRWRADTPDERLGTLRAIVARFPAAIPGVVSAAIGPSVSPEGLESGFGWGLAVTFRDATARDRYLVDPTHAEAAALIGEWAEGIAVVDITA